MNNTEARRKRRADEIERALSGEPGVARQLLYGIYFDLRRHTDDDRVDIEPVRLNLEGVEYLRRAIPLILAGIPADIALGLKSGDPGRPIVSQDSAWWRAFLVRAGVRELIESKSARSKTAAFKFLAEHRRYPDLHDPDRDISLAWTTVRDIYYGRKL